MYIRIDKLLVSFSLIVVSNTTVAYSGSSFNEVYRAVFEEPYEMLPEYEVNRELFGPSGNRDNNQLQNAAIHTLTVKDDLVDYSAGQKLLQPNGICFSGDWEITAETPYTGQLATGTTNPAIVRASVSLSETTSRHKRAFSMAVKIFPTSDPEAKVFTRNLLTMETIAGTRKKYFLDAVLDNAPPLGGMPSFGNITLSVRIYNDMKAADTAYSPGGPDLMFRPVSQLATDNAPDKPVISPKWIRLRIAGDTPRTDKADFRAELNLKNYPDQQLIWLIDAAEETQKGKPGADWKNIGRLVLTESVVSKGCDAKLHFAHPVIEKP